MFLVLIQESFDSVNVGDQHDRITVVGIRVPAFLRVNELSFLHLEECLFHWRPSLWSASHRTLAWFRLNAEFETFDQGRVLLLDMEIGIWVRIYQCEDVGALLWTRIIDI